MGLESGKDEYLYCEVFCSIIVALKYHWSPKVVVVDFEQALQNAVQYQFADSRMVGYYFHFQQALYRKMAKVSVVDHIASTTMQFIERLACCGDHEILSFVSYIESNLTTSDHGLAAFRRHFRVT